MPQHHEKKEGLELGTWVARQRLAHSKGELSEGGVKRLEKIGIVWKKLVSDATWEAHFGLLSQYLEEKSGRLVPQHHETKEGLKLGTWVAKQRVVYSKGEQSKGRVKELEELEFVLKKLVPDATW